MNYYYFCQKCKDHFETIGAKSHKRVLFAASFLCGKINFCWQQHKLYVERERVNPVIWEKFKTFLRKSQGDLTLFVDNIWSKIKVDSQYQQKEVQDWASHLEHLYFIFMEFDAKYAPSEDLFIWYFYKHLKPSIKLQIDKKGRKLDGQEEPIRKTTRAKAKGKIQLAFSRNINQHYYCGNQLMHTSLDKTTKDSKIEELKPKAQEPKVANSSSSPNQDGNAEIFNKAWKEKKKHQRQEKQKKNTNAGTSGTSASGINITNNFGEKKRAQLDLAQVTC